MVKIREDLPQTVDGRVDLEYWIEHLPVLFSAEDKDLLRRAGALSLAHGLNIETPLFQNCFQQGLATAVILLSLKVDAITLAASMLYFTARYSTLSPELIVSSTSPAVLKLIEGVHQIDKTQDIAMMPTWSKNMQRDNLRRMLLAVVEDIRVVLIKLAEQVSSLRIAKDLPEAIRKRLGEETRDIFAPLANRLGIGQIKWELEDLAFRYLDPEAYKSIASLLSEKRLVREAYIQRLLSDIQTSLLAEGIAAEVTGRVKHIYSIWRKMRRKNIEFGEIYDTRAVRILTTEVRDCYAALGIVHSLWQHIPHEFDDYIASPKENGYRSLHTAVLGPEGKVVEIQIRTNMMHQEAELGVAAHWVYKEGGKADEGYRLKLSSLRKILEWQDEIEPYDNDSDQFSQTMGEIFDDRVYVFTPKGEVIDLPEGSTPLDFAYHIHSQIGHRCRGAKLNGHIVTLNTLLKSGDQVEILTAKHEHPSRDWLNPHTGYLHSARARAKVQHWFRQQNRSENISAGREILERELKRLSVDIPLRKVAHKIGCTSIEDLEADLGAGVTSIAQVLTVISRLLAEQVIESREPDLVVPLKSPKVHANVGDVTVAGVGNLAYQFAKCCKPIPGDLIVGYITQGRGVTVHRTDCCNIIDEQEKSENRLIQVSWQDKTRSLFLVELKVISYDRAGLLNDITAVLMREKVDVVQLYTKTEPDHTVCTLITVQILDLQQLGKVLTRIAQLPNVIEAYRVQPGH